MTLMNKTTENINPEMRIFIARQPIFDVQQHVYAYELLFRSHQTDRAQAPDSEYATVKLIANSLLIGLKKLTAQKRAMINFNRQLLLGKIPLLFPNHLLGIEILETVEPEDKIITVCKNLKKEGYPIILDDFVFDEKYWAFIQLADIIKIDFQATSPRERQDILQRVSDYHIDFLAEKIETREDYEEALRLGYIYFQGYFFQKPDLIYRKDIPGYKLNYMHILKKIHRPILELHDIEDSIKRDVSLAYKLLRFINSASFGFRVTVRSVHHALTLLGEREVKKWLSIIIMSGIGKEKPPELINTCIIRAKLCESIAQTFKIDSHEPEEYFLLGMFSLIHAFLDRPLEEILEELPLDDHIKNALLDSPGTMQKLLNLVIAYEKAQWDETVNLAASLSINLETVSHLYLEAVEWAALLPH